MLNVGVIAGFNIERAKNLPRYAQNAINLAISLLKRLETPEKPLFALRRRTLNAVCAAEIQHGGPAKLQGKTQMEPPKVAVPVCCLLVKFRVN